MSRPACKGLSLALFIFCSCPSTKSAPKNFLEHAVPDSIYHVERLGSRDLLTVVRKRGGEEAESRVGYNISKPTPSDRLPPAKLSS